MWICRPKNEGRKYLFSETSAPVLQLWYFKNTSVFDVSLDNLILAKKNQNVDKAYWSVCVIKSEKPLNTGLLNSSPCWEHLFPWAGNGGNIIISVNIFGYKLARPLSGSKKWGKYISILGQNKAVLTPLGWHNKLFGEIRVAESKIKWK